MDDYRLDEVLPGERERGQGRAAQPAGVLFSAACPIACPACPPERLAADGMLSPSFCPCALQGFRNDLGFLYCLHTHARGSPAWLELVPTHIVHAWQVGLPAAMRCLFHPGLWAADRAACSHVLRRWRAIPVTCTPPP